MHSSTHAIHVRDKADVAAVLRGSWPKVAVITVASGQQSAASNTIYLPKDSNFEVMASLDSVAVHYHDHPAAWIARQEWRENAAALLVRSEEHVGQIDQHIAIAFASLRSSYWLKAVSLTISVHSQKTAVIEHFAQLHWPDLRHLELSNSSLSCTAVDRLLSHTQLTRVDLSLPNLSHAAMEALARGTWGKLSAVRVALKAYPPALLENLKQKSSGLRVSLQQLDRSFVASVHMHLTFLTLESIGTGVEAMSQLCSVSWPSLRCLTLSQNVLSADAVASLASLALPSLVCLDLGSNKLDATSANLLARGDWPKLDHLMLNGNHLDDAAVACFARSEWPALRTLWLIGNDVSISGVQSLLADNQWPELCAMFLDSNIVCAATWQELDLAPSVSAISLGDDSSGSVHSLVSPSLVTSLCIDRVEFHLKLAKVHVYTKLITCCTDRCR